MPKAGAEVRRQHDRTVYSLNNADKKEPTKALQYNMWL
jgi:hypothetical protein